MPDFAGVCEAHILNEEVKEMPVAKDTTMPAGQPEIPDCDG